MQSLGDVSSSWVAPPARKHSIQCILCFAHLFRLMEKWVEEVFVVQLYLWFSCTNNSRIKIRICEPLPDLEWFLTKGLPSSILPNFGLSTFCLLWRQVISLIPMMIVMYYLSNENTMDFVPEIEKPTLCGPLAATTSSVPLFTPKVC